MFQNIQNKVVFGPVFSRRLGNSLGLNLFEPNRKVCTYNCIYCECNWTMHSFGFYVDSNYFIHKVEEAFKNIRNFRFTIDTITFAGSGEPTLHPDFLFIVKQTIILRNQYLPNIPIAVLTNSTQLNRSDIIEALSMIEKPIFKLDTSIQKTFELINQPLVPIDVNEIIENIANFSGQKILQTMLIKGIKGNIEFDNTNESELNSLAEAYKRIKPNTIMLYTIARATPLKTIRAIDYSSLQDVANYLLKFVPDVKIECYS